MESEKRKRIIRAIIGLLIPAVIAVSLVAFAPPGVYLWVKAIHIASAVTWIGGMLGLSYLLSWHAGVKDAAVEKLLSEMERQVLGSVVNPAMVLAWGIGLWLAWDAGWFVSGWFQGKLALVLLLSAIHGWIVGAMRAAEQGKLLRSPKMLRNVTLIGSLITVGAIALAVVKPM